MPTPSKQQQQQQQQRAPASSLPTTTATAATTTSTAAETAAACCEASEAAAADNETRFLFSLGDAALKNGHAISADSTTTTTTTTKAAKARLDEMTVSSGLQNSEDSEMVTVDVNAAADANKDVGVNSKDNWTCSDMAEDEEEEDDGGRLSSEEPEAINLCSKDLQQQPPPMTAFAASDVPMMSAKMRLKKQRLEAAIWASSNDGLHKLAEAAERKQVSPKDSF